MNDEQKFQFDLHGYTVIRGVLNEVEVAELNRLADEKFPRQEGDDLKRSTFKIIDWGKPVLDLIDHPRLTPCLDEFLGPKFRLDHDYCIFMQKGGSRGKLHGGPHAAPDHWYRYTDGVIRNGLCVLGVAISDVGPGDGGFCCIPGSHKTNFMDSVPDDVRSYERDADYVVQPALKAGDAVLFTEALIHGTMPWTANHERRALLFKYAPGHSAWSGDFYDVDAYGTVSDQQRRILERPFIGGRKNSLLQPA